MKRYEVEVDRSAKTPKQFWNACQKIFEKKTGMGLEDWVGSFEEWENPEHEYNIYAKHEDWETPQREVLRTKPLEYQIYLQGAYNFILEWFEGHGYMYAVEYSK